MVGFKDENNIALVGAFQLRKENLILRANNHFLKEEDIKAFNGAKEDLNEVMNTSKLWVVKAFKMLVE